ncbi:MAG: ABC transporter permease [Armatimonadota bacterium]|nr:MAG: ABC transporter permease [Armatimonadota bacterium]
MGQQRDNSHVIGDVAPVLAWQRVAEWLRPLAALIVMGVILSFASPHFLTPNNLATVAVQASAVAILAVAETMVIISGNIDLSVGSVLALCGCAAALLMRSGVGIAPSVLLGVALGVGVGTLSGALTAFGRMPSFIVTLGMMGIARGAALIITGGVNVFGVPQRFADLSMARRVGIPLPALLAGAVAVAAHVVLTRTSLGRSIYAIGGNPEAARLSGIPVKRVVTIIFAIAGLLSALAGLALTSRLSIGQPTAGVGYELDAIAAAVIGGASLMGGQGTVAGTLIGALIMAVLRNGCDLLRVPVFWQQVAIGVIIIAAVFLDQFRRRR